MIGQQLGTASVDATAAPPSTSGAARRGSPRTRDTSGLGAQEYPVAQALIASRRSGPVQNRLQAHFAQRHLEAPSRERSVSRRGPSASYLRSRAPIAEMVSMVRQLLARDRVLAARKLIQAVPSTHAPDESLRRLRLVLAKPVVLRRLPARTLRSGDLDWLRRNAASYSGKWVALADGTLLAADKSLSALRRSLKEHAPHAKPLLHRL